MPPAQEAPPTGRGSSQRRGPGPPLRSATRGSGMVVCDSPVKRRCESASQNAPRHRTGRAGGRTGWRRSRTPRGAMRPPAGLFPSAQSWMAFWTLLRNPSGSVGVRDQRRLGRQDAVAMAERDAAEALVRLVENARAELGPNISVVPLESGVTFIGNAMFGKPSGEGICLFQESDAEGRLEYRGEFEEASHRSWDLA